MTTSTAETQETTQAKALASEPKASPKPNVAPRNSVTSVKGEHGERATTPSRADRHQLESHWPSRGCAIGTGSCCARGERGADMVGLLR
jgi:hypothetical protein